MFVEVFSYPDEVPDTSVELVELVCADSAVELAKLDCSDEAAVELVEFAYSDAA